MKAFDKNKIYQESLTISVDKDIYFIQDIIDSLYISKTTFYTFFPEDSDELNTLKENLFKNRINEKKLLRQKLGKGSGSELIALYKLIGNDEERKALSTNWTELSGEIASKSILGITFNE